METQAISAPVERLTREAPKRQVGYGLPCAKCHKYFPADIEVCPICKGRERVSPIVAPKIKKPVQSETSVAASSTNVALKQDVKESPKPESAALILQKEIKAKDQTLDQKGSIPTPVVAEIPVTAEPARAGLVSTHRVSTPTEKETPKSEPAALILQKEIKAKDQTLDQKESIPTPVVAEIPVTAEPAHASLVSTQTIVSPKEKEYPESPAIAPRVEIKVKDQPLNQKESTTTSVVARLVPTEKKESSKSESPAFVPSVEINVQDQPLDQKESTAVPVVQLPAAVGPPLASPISTPKAEEHSKLESPAITCLNDQPNTDQPDNDQPQKERIATAALVETQASDSALAVAVLMPKELECPTKLEPAAAALPMQLDTEEQRREKINEALRIVIPMLVEDRASEAAPVAAKQEILERETKKEAPEMSKPRMSASEVKPPAAKVIEVKIAEVKPIETPAVVDRANHRPGEEKSKAIDKDSDDSPRPTDVSAPVVVHLNLGELGASKSTPERASAQSPSKIERTESETSHTDISSDAEASESPAPVSGHRFDLVTFALGVVVLACAVLLITLAAIRLMPRHISEPVRRAKAAYSSTPTTDDQKADAAIPNPQPTTASLENSASPNSSPAVASSPAPAQSPAPSATSQLSPAGSKQVLTLPEGLAEGNLLYRVEPDYPEEARRQGVQGPVVLDLHIGKDGLVQGVDLVSGQPLLAQAATAAVKQWRFRTRYVNGNEVAMQARITLHFALPTS